MRVEQIWRISLDSGAVRLHPAAQRAGEGDRSDLSSIVMALRRPLSGCGDVRPVDRPAPAQPMAISRSMVEAAMSGW